ncbi:interactor of constitutive active ROPs 3 [Sesamum indicum]|uniref:Interactor of constitutive active ROPs 3 n=1 Tax=Sesamum indicum TaxID=4182 RepID=A0A6I9U0D2_SESIN|nr:interactor of constitutive active ROPs 3 [Sesamum indicum]XP_020552496.1 interactor of constitutive active ROPs 3 [Sesamum indicum]XP_020552497.1 interactor of constitutive active ROPs 3 [Sesamum indicum]XP_020552498.1 interactor of constitutive active ROPs 3 [Sesamum indicum]XP_020552499.1 interactor of constitutive active ROPs 3 [Sesamum indicum]XP_020552500.1 interactor of constitutive active ROPs 3 [Sesamum indicum]
MQTPKARTSSSGAPQKNSPRSISSEATQKNSPQAASSEASQKFSPRVVRQLKTSPRYSDHTASSSNQVSRAPKEKSPKVADHRSPRSPASEKRRPSRVSELESQVSQLENDLKIVKDRLCSTEELKKQAQKDAEESNQQLLALSLKLQESQKQLLEQSAPKEVLCEITEERDEKLQSELEAIQKQHSSDSAALASALDEIKQLKTQLEIVAESEATHSKNSEAEQNELHKLRENLSNTLMLVEDMKNQLRDSKESETQAQALVGETLVQLEAAKKMVEMLRSDGLKATEAYNSVASELDQSRARVNFLEELVSKLKADIHTGGSKDSLSEGDDLKQRTQESLEMEVNSVKVEVEQLRSALEAAEIRYNEEQAQSAEQIRNALEMVEKIKSASGQREAELESELRKSKYEIEELKANLMDKETELQGICEENEGLTVKLENTLSGQGEHELEKKLQKSNAEIENLKVRLMDKETEWQHISEENEKLKLEIKEMIKGKVSDEIVSDIESARAAEREALMKIGYMTEEVDKSNRKAARVAEQLEAAQAANAEMEAELRRLKVQSDQWRKAAEAAAAMLSAGNNGHLMERTGSMDSNYSPRTGKISSPYADDLDEDLMKKKNANMLRRFGVLWKKPQK